MDHKRMLLNQLLNKVEARKTDKQRVFIRFSKGEYAPYEEADAAEKQEIHAAVEQLTADGFIQYEWMPHETGNQLKRLWLILPRLDDVYRYMRRKPLEEKSAAVEKTIAQCAQALRKPWLRSALEQDAGARKEECLSEFLHMIRAVDALLEHRTLAQRVFSVQCFSDSKRFEQKYRSKLLRLLRNSLGNEAMTDTQLLEYAGIVKNPSIIEFCGAIRLVWEDAVIDYSVMPDGASLLSLAAEKLKEIDASQISRIISIENRTSYYEYICNEKQANELVLFSGGFLSPSSKHFYGLLAQSQKTFVHWGDIDLGGMKIFLQIQTVVPQLGAFRMDCDTLNTYRQDTILCEADYISKCKAAKEQPEFFAFQDALQWIITNKRKLEQENISLI